jgi:hypothetical protein
MPMMVDSDVAFLFFFGSFNIHHIGELRCRQEGTSTTSVEPFMGRTAR